jgi:Zn-dependent M28 family amino/carboxypeptidase
VNELAFPIPNLVGETSGHNLEAILPGRSADSIVIIVHYDTVGITGKETQNPGADDDGSGLAMQMEAARLFAAIPDRAQTVRFVAADYEEISNNLDGDYAYVKYLQGEAAAKGFKILVASDDDQTAWSCWSENLCTTTPPKNSTFQMISCSGDALHYDYPELSAGILAVAQRYSTTVKPSAVCDGSGDTDHYPFWQAGIPAYVIEEWGSENNPHYDNTGDDTMAHIDLDLFAETSRIQIAYQAELAGVTP